MMSWQLVSLAFVIGVFALTSVLRKRMRAKQSSFFDGSMSAFRTDVANARQHGESEPIAVVATERKMLSAKLFYVAITDRSFFVQLGGTPTRRFDRAAVAVTCRAKTFTDVGNMTTTYTSGYELTWTLSDGERHTCRVYAEAHGIADHGAHVQALVHQLAA
jgi:hypothetical protein